MFLPNTLAKQLAGHIGAPGSFQYPQSTTKVSYVSPAKAIWSDQEQSFKLSISNEFLFDLEIHSDRRFYFALAVYLERAPNVYPKDAFWILLSAGYEQSTDYISLKVQARGLTFNLPMNDFNKDGGLTGACEAIVNQIEDILSFSPLALDRSSPASNVSTQA